MKIIAIANQKGGTAKTTTVAALAVLLGPRGTPVHVVDMDPQASLTFANFQDAINDCLARINNEGKRDMKSLISRNFQLFDKRTFLAS